MSWGVNVGLLCAGKKDGQWYLLVEQRPESVLFPTKVVETPEQVFQSIRDFFYSLTGIHARNRARAGGWVDLELWDLLESEGEITLFYKAILDSTPTLPDGYRWEFATQAGLITFPHLQILDRLISFAGE